MHINNIYWHAKSIINLSKLCQDLRRFPLPGPIMCLLPSLVAVGRAAGQGFRFCARLGFFEPHNGSVLESEGTAAAAALKGKKVIELLLSLCATNVFFLTIPVIIFRAVKVSCASTVEL